MNRTAQRPVWRISVATAMLLLAGTTAIYGAQAPLDQHLIAEQVLGRDVARRNQGVDEAASLGPAKIGRELRGALIILLSRENAVVADVQKRGTTLDTMENPEFISGLQRLVAELRDPQAIPALAGALGMGTVTRALAEFGDQASAEVLAVVTSRASHYTAVDDGLRTLRLMVEAKKTRPLSATTLEQIRRAAQMRLTEQQGSFTTVWYSIDLALVLDNPALKGIVVTLSRDTEAVKTSGVKDPALIAKTQQRARDRLAGIPALPRP